MKKIVRKALSLMGLTSLVGCTPQCVYGPPPSDVDPGNAISSEATTIEQETTEMESVEIFEPSVEIPPPVVYGPPAYFEEEEGANDADE